MTSECEQQPQTCIPACKGGKARFRNFIVVQESEPVVQEPLLDRLRKADLYRSNDTFYLHVNTIKPTLSQFIQEFFPEAVVVRGVMAKALDELEHYVYVRSYKDKDEDAVTICERMQNEQWQRQLRQHAIANNYRKQYGHMHTKKPDHMPSSGQSGYVRSDKMARIARSKPAPRTYPASSKEQINMLQILVTSLMAGPPVDRRDLIRELEKINNRLTTLKSNPTWGFEPLTNTQRAWLNHETPPMPDNEMA